jgi:hypothetical protein
MAKSRDKKKKLKKRSLLGRAEERLKARKLQRTAAQPEASKAAAAGGGATGPSEGDGA